MLQPEVSGWARDVADRLPEDHPACATVLGVVAGGLAMTGRLDDAARLATLVVATEPDGRAALYALEALGDTASYQGRIDDIYSACDRAHRLAGELGDRLYVDYNRAWMALALAYAGRRDDALELVAAPASTAAPSATGWLRYAHGESILDHDPPLALASLDVAIDIARSVGDRYLAEVAMLSASSLLARAGDVDEAAARYVALLDHFSAGGDLSHLVTTLRNLVTLFVRLGEPAAGAELLGAVAAHTSSPSYGAEAERLAEAVEQIELGLTERHYRECLTRGRARSVDEAATVASAVLRHLVLS